MVAPVFDNYVLLKRLGEGGMGTVYLAREMGGLDRLVVIKAIRGEWLDQDMATTRFLEEARITARLVHPNIVAIHALGRAASGPYLVMEHVRGASLSSVLRMSAASKRPIPIPVVLQIGIELCKALHFAHNYVDEQGQSHQIVHRDIKPANVLIAYTGQVKLIDFGIAKSDLSMLKTQSGMFQGTAPYVSPEQARSKPVDPRSDIFSLGTVLYEALSGKRPFAREDVLTTLNAIVEDAVPPPPRDGAEELGDVLLRALRKDPEERYSSALEFQLALEMCLLAYRERHAEAEDQLEVYLSRLFPEQRVDFTPPGELTASPVAEPSRMATADLAGSPDARFGGPVSPVSAAADGSVASRLQVVEDKLSPRKQPAKKRWPILVATAALLVAAGVVALILTLLPPVASTTAGDAGRRLPAKTTVDAAQRQSAAKAALARLPPKPDAAPAARPHRTHRERPQSGALRIRTVPAARIRFAGSNRRGLARLILRRPSGLIEVDGPFMLLLRFQASESGGVLVTADSRPWCIAYPSGMPPKRVPLAGIVVTDSERRIDFRRPGTTEEMSIWLRRD